MFWFEYGQIILCVWFFNVYWNRIVCFLLNAKYLTSLSYIDFVPDQKHNLYLNKHALTAWLIVLPISCISNSILQFAICTNTNLVNLGKEPKIFLKKKIVSMKTIHFLEDSFSDKSLWLRRNGTCLLPEMYGFTLVRKRGVICAVTTILIIPIQGVY